MSLAERIMTRGEYPYRARSFRRGGHPMPPPELELQDVQDELPPRRQLHRCAACDVTWRGQPACWCCGSPVTVPAIEI